MVLPNMQVRERIITGHVCVTVGCIIKNLRESKKSGVLYPLYPTTFDDTAGRQAEYFFYKRNDSRMLLTLYRDAWAP